MGIRFVCHGCGRRLNIKSGLAGKRGVCPGCSLRFRIPFSNSGTSLPITPGEPLEKIEETIAREEASAPSELSESLPKTKQFVTTLKNVNVQVGQHLIQALQHQGTVGVLTTVVTGRDGQQRVISASLGEENVGLVEELLRIAKLREAQEHDSASKNAPAHDTDQEQDTLSEAELVEAPKRQNSRQNFAPWRA